MGWTLDSAFEWDRDKDGNDSRMDSCLGWCLHILAWVSLSLFLGICDMEGKENSAPPLHLVRQRAQCAAPGVRKHQPKQ